MSMEPVLWAVLTYIWGWVALDHAAQKRWVGAVLAGLLCVCYLFRGLGLGG